MSVIYIEDIDNFKDDVEKEVCIGLFDGVHIGHQKLISEFLKSSSNGYLITFAEHKNKELMIPAKKKIELLNKLGAKKIYVLSPKNFKKNKDEFINFLENINTKKIVVGSDFKFGNNATGNVEDLRKKFNVNIVEFFLFDDNKISSSTIRASIKKGQMENVQKMLGYPYQITGEVVYGKQIGRTIDFPTANIISNQIVPKQGIYITRTTIYGKIYQSVTNIGSRPSIQDDDIISIETHILDFNEDIYGVEISVDFIKRIRGEIKFENLEQLKQQIKKDIKKVEEFYGN